MTMQELLIQSMNICNHIVGVYDVDIYAPDDITIMFKNSKGYKYIVDFQIKLNGHVYEKYINFITYMATDERFSELDYTQEELNDMLKKVNK